MPCFNTSYFIQSNITKLYIVFYRKKLNFFLSLIKLGYTPHTLLIQDFSKMTSKHLRPLWRDFSYFPHQIDGIHWMLDKEINGTAVPNKDGATNTIIYGGFQCDDMGLGKTIQIASVIINNPCRYTLLIAPLAMIDTWASVLSKAGCAVHQVLDGEWTTDFTAPVRPTRRIRPAIFITNYEKLYHRPSLFKREWDRVVLDEAHKIRNGDGDVARYARKIIAPIRWVVTGTPLVNSLKDVVSLFAFLGVPTSKLWRWEPRFELVLPQLLLHRSLDSLRSLIKDAPPVPQIHHLYLPFDTVDEEEFYYGVQGAGEFYAKERLSSSEAFKLLLRLRQLSVHPQVYINAKRRELGRSYTRPDWKGSSTKLHKIKEIISSNTDAATPHNYIIFCQFMDEMSLMRQFLIDEGLVDDERCLLYCGSMTQSERAETLLKSKQLCKPPLAATDTTTKKPTILLLQLHAGGVGLNLQEYDRMIFVSPWWTSAMIDQAVARSVRMGQTKTVHVYHLHLDAESSSEFVDIDLLVNSKADQKRKMLEKLFILANQDYYTTSI